MIRPRLALAAVAVLVAGAAGCGAATPAGELDPTLRTQLTQVDQALAAGDYSQARDALDTLGEQTATARDDGRISSQQADRILSAVSRVAADLPDPTTTPALARPPALPGGSGRNTGERPDVPEDIDASRVGDTPGGGEQQGNGEENGKAEENGKREEKGESENKGKSEEKGKEAERGGGETSGGPDGPRELTKASKGRRRRWSRRTIAPRGSTVSTSSVATSFGRLERRTGPFWKITCGGFFDRTESCPGTTPAVTDVCQTRVIASRPVDPTYLGSVGGQHQAQSGPRGPRPR